MIESIDILNLLNFNKIRKLTFLLLFLYLLVGAAKATDYYVSPTGTGDGLTINTPGDPSALDTVLVAGDRMLFLPGEYINKSITLNNSGTLAQPILITAYQDTPTLIGDNVSTAITLKSYTNVSNLRMENYLVSIYTKAGTDINISNNQIFVPPKNISSFVSYKYGIYLIETNNTEISNNNITMNINKESLAASQGCAGIWISGNNSYISGNTVEGHAHNSICLVGFAFGESGSKVSHDLYVRDNYIANNSVHGGLDVAGDINDLWIENNTFFRASALYVHKQVNGTYRLHFNNNIITQSPRIDFSWTRDSIASDNQVYDSTGDAFYNYVEEITQPINLTLKNNYICNTTGYTFRMSTKNATGIGREKLIIENTSGSNIKYVIEGNSTKGIVRIPKGAEKFNILTSRYAISTVEFSDNRLFKIEKTYGYSPCNLTSPLWYPDKSNFTVESLSSTGWGYNVTSYPLTITPKLYPVTVSDTIKLNTSLPLGSTIASITVNSTNCNEVNFVLSDLESGVYTVAKDGRNISTQCANNGEISWKNSDWLTAHTFTVEEVSSSSGGNSLPSQEPPVSSAGSDKIVYSCSRVCFDGSKSTGDNISYKWDFDASNGIQTDATGPIVNYTYENPGIYTVTLTVTDANNNTDSDTCTVTVVEKQVTTKLRIFSPNASLPGKTFTVDLLIDPSTPITGTQLDFVFDSSMVSANSVTEGDFLKQDGIYTIFSRGTINNSAGTVKNIYGFILGTSNASTPGNFATVNLTAGNKTGIAEFSLSNVLISDANSKSVPYTVTNATVLIDTAPVINPICCPKSVDERSTMTFKVSAKDADGDRLVLSASGLPQGAVFNTTSGNFTWTPERGQAGVYTIAFKVSDGYLTDSQSVTLTVNKLNNPPLISSFEPLNGSSFSEGERIRILVNASDANGQTLDYSIRIDGVVYATEKEYVWETDYSSSGNHTIEVVVSDGIDEVKKQHIVSITDCRPRWDVNEDGIVNILDITIVSKNYGAILSKPYPRYDVNQDGEVNIQDLTLVGHYFGEIVK